MGCAHSKKEVEGSFKVPVPRSFNLPTPVRDQNQAERKEDGFYKLRKDADDHDGHSSSVMAAKLTTRSKVHSLLVKYKGNNVVDRSFSFQTVNVKEVEQLPKCKAEPKVGIWQRVVRGVKVADESFGLLEKSSEKIENGKFRWRSPPGGEDKVVLYFTSLMGIRKTFDDCCIAKSILWCFGVLVDERDISMHALFRHELQDLLGKPITVPSLFIAGKYIGGIEEIQQLHEAGELAKYLGGFPLHTSCTRPCYGCGDARFVPCLNCDGSCKVFTQEKGGRFQPQDQFMRCSQCNENGIIRCPVCCVAAFLKT